MPLIDLHTHTHPLSYDSALSPDELIEAARRAGLDGVCLTEHDFFWDCGQAYELGRRHNFLVIPGIEVNTENGHVLVFGLEKFIYGMHRLHELARMVDEAGGVMLAAHPYRRQLPFELRKEGDWTEALQKAAQNPLYHHVQGIEFHNGRGRARENSFTRALAEALNLPRVAGSDCHEAADVGACATEFERPISGLDGLIAELKAGRVHPVVMRDAGER
jgi:predicted metal-dependent phosphoesterase TrpH